MVVLHEAKYSYIGQNSDGFHVFERKNYLNRPDFNREILFEENAKYIHVDGTYTKFLKFSKKEA